MARIQIPYKELPSITCFMCLVGMTLLYAFTSRCHEFAVICDCVISRSHSSFLFKSALSHVTNLQPMKSEPTVTVRKKSVSCFPPGFENNFKTFLLFSPLC